jgi:hypothetical protein
MKLLRTFFALMLATSLVAADVPACRAATDRATAESLARDSGLWKALGDVLADLHTDLDHAIAESEVKPDRKELGELERRIDTAFAPGRLQEIGVAIVEKELDPEHVPALQAWFGSTAGKAITKAETAAPGGQQGLLKLRKEGAALLEQVPEARRDLLEEILIAARASELAATIAVQSVLVLASAVRRAAPDAGVPSEQRLRTELAAARPRMEREISSSMLQMFAAIYRRIPDADLRKYEEVLTSAAGRHLTGVVAHAVEEAVVAGTKHFWEDLLPAGKPAA